MNCMKCGREVPAGQVFCDDCLADMAKHPVDPGTPVQVPRRQNTPVRTVPKKRAVPVEEQLRDLKKRIRYLIILALLGWALALALTYPAVKYLMEDHFAPGQNYSSTGSQITGAETRRR